MSRRRARTSRSAAPGWSIPRRDARVRARSSCAAACSRRSPGWTATRPTGSSPTASSWPRASSTSTPTCASLATRMPRRSRAGLAAAAHGGFTTVCAMPNTAPALDEPGVLAQDPGRRRRVRLAGRAAGLRRGHGRAGRGAAGRPGRAGRRRRRRVLRRRPAHRIRTDPAGRAGLRRCARAADRRALPRTPR